MMSTKPLQGGKPGLFESTDSFPAGTGTHTKGTLYGFDSNLGYWAPWDPTNENMGPPYGVCAMDDEILDASMGLALIVLGPADMKLSTNVVVGDLIIPSTTVAGKGEKYVRKTDFTDPPTKAEMEAELDVRDSVIGRVINDRTSDIFVRVYMGMR